MAEWKSDYVPIFQRRRSKKKKKKEINTLAEKDKGNKN